MKENPSHFTSDKTSIYKSFRLIKHFDYSLLFAVLCLCSFGLLIIYSTTHMESMNEENSIFLVKRQIFFIILGLALCLLIALIDYHEVEKIAILIYFLAIIALTYVILFGKIAGGSRRWIVIAGFDFQPAEFAKIALICFLADFLSRKRDQLSDLLYFSLPFFFTGILMLLIFKQPDLGTSLVFVAILLCMIYIAGIPWKYILFVSFIILLSFPVMWSMLQEYQKKRIIFFLNPNLDPLGAGYNVIQSKVAIGSGGLLGQGLFSGIQSQLKFLPARQTDFVFSVLGEEMGFIGALLVLILFIFILWKGINIAREAPDALGIYLATGVIAFLSFHILVNVGMAMGLVPTTGLPLPFVSHGGTFMISNFMGIGLLLNIHIRSLFI